MISNDSSSTSMLNVEPQSLVFRNVTLNQTYTTSVCISNPLTAGVDISLRPSNPRYQLSPNKATLGPGQSVVVTVRLLLAHYPNMKKGVQGVEDTLHIKSRYFEQSVSVTFFLDQSHTGMGAMSALEGRPPLNARSSSPGRVAFGPGADPLLTQAHAELQAKDDRICNLEEQLEIMQAPYPELKDAIAKALELEREVF